MEISGSCFSSHLAAAQMEAALMPTPMSQEWSHGGQAGGAELLSAHRNPIESSSFRPSGSLESPAELCSFRVRLLIFFNFANEEFEINQIG